MATPNGEHAPRKRIWVQHVASETDKIEMRVEAARVRGGLTEAQEVIADGVMLFVRKARLAAFRDDPIPNRLANWWRGTLVETAYRRMHTARAQLIDLYDDDELLAEVPLVVARAAATLPRDDPRRLTVADLVADPPAVRRARMRRLVGDTYEQLDLDHSQLRSFRNILLSAAMFLVLIVVTTLVFVWFNPEVIPLCFTDVEQPYTSCPTGEGPDQKASRDDILVVIVLGALGGALSATLSIRNLKGTSTPYDVPVALAALKVPMGALTAFLGLVAIQGGFVPGLSVLDTQGQVLAYALVFGFAQQALSHLLDRQAQNLLEGLPGGTGVDRAPPVRESLLPAEVGATAPRPAAPGTSMVAGAPTDAETDEDLLDVRPSAPPGKDRPVEEPADATQADQFDLLRETGNERRDMTEEEEAAALEAEFGPPDADGIYGARADGRASDDEDGPPAPSSTGGG